MAIEINSRAKYYKSIFTWPVIASIICVILILILLSLYFFFSFSSRGLKQSIQTKENQSSALNQSIFKEEAKIIPIRDKMDSFKSLVDQHQTPLNVFPVIEQNTFPNVWFSQLDFNFLERTAMLSAQTDNLASVEQQITHFKKEPLLEQVSLSGVSLLDEGKGVDFEIKLILKPEVFE